MSKKTLLIIAAVAVMLAAGATVALADYDFEGDAPDTAGCGGIHPWHPWQGTVYTVTSPNYFRGYWGNDPDNWIYGVVTSITARDTCYGVSNGTWAYDSVQVGHWSGNFCLAFRPPPPDSSPRDTAFGEWWHDTIDTCRDIFWGDFAGD